jgi:hypothetical protein
MVTIMSDLFENIELQMQADAKEKNPRSAILASQMETEKRFGNFIDENINRVSIIEKEIKNVTDKFAHQYDVDPKMVYEATVSYLTKNADLEIPNLHFFSMYLRRVPKYCLSKTLHPILQLHLMAHLQVQDAPYIPDSRGFFISEHSIQL